MRRARNFGVADRPIHSRRDESRDRPISVSCDVMCVRCNYVLLCAYLFLSNYQIFRSDNFCNDGPMYESSTDERCSDDNCGLLFGKSALPFDYAIPRKGIALLTQAKGFSTDNFEDMISLS